MEAASSSEEVGHRYIQRHILEGFQLY